MLPKPPKEKGVFCWAGWEGVESPAGKEAGEKEEPAAKGLEAGAELEAPKPPEKLKLGWLPPPKEKGVELP